MDVRVAIVDDHTLVGIALGRLLQQDYQIVGTYNDARAFLRDAATIIPDVVVLDMMMPSVDGLQAATEIRKRLPRTRIIFLTASEDLDLAYSALAAGAAGYVLKSSAGSELRLAIREVMGHGRYITPLIAGRLARQPTRAARDPKRLQQLTPRQREVLKILASGHSMKEAAAILNLSVRTVAFHKYRIMTHLDLKSNAELIQIAVREGLI